jgi:soluble lytic murein transglycosylase-like protein
MTVRLICALCSLWLVACAAEPDHSAARAAQEASAEKQRASARAQEAVIAARNPSTFFTPPARPSPPEPACDRPADAEIRQVVDAGARRVGLDINLVRALVRRESAYNPCAISVKGAQGLMQLMPSVQTEFGVTNPYDPGQNVDAGTRLLKQLLNQYRGDLPRALSAYNSGAASVERWGGVPPFPETMSYVSAILAELFAKQGVATER